MTKLQRIIDLTLMVGVIVVFAALILLVVGSVIALIAFMFGWI